MLYRSDESTGKWSQLEMSFINLNPELSHVQAYQTYLQNYHDQSVGTRTFGSLKRKHQRLMLRVRIIIYLLMTHTDFHNDIHKI